VDCNRVLLDILAVVLLIYIDLRNWWCCFLSNFLFRVL